MVSEIWILVYLKYIIKFKWLYVGIDYYDMNT